MLITRAPRSTAQWMARASASGEIVPSARTILAIRSSTGKPTAAMPVPLFVAAAISPATKVPWPFVSVSHELETKLRPSAIWLWRSGWPESMPESSTATRTFASVGTCAQASKAWIRPRYHCRLISGSLGVNASRRVARMRSTQDVPLSECSSPACCARTERANGPIFVTGSPVAAWTSRATARSSAPFWIPIANRSAEACAGTARASTNAARTSRFMPVRPSTSGSRRARSRGRARAVLGTGQE